MRSYHTKVPTRTPLLLLVAYLLCWSIIPIQRIGSASARTLPQRPLFVHQDIMDSHESLRTWHQSTGRDSHPHNAPTHESPLWSKDEDNVAQIKTAPLCLDNESDDIGIDIELKQKWQVLGPFPTGMREQDFGADPLEAFGGFKSLKYDPKATFPSELAKHGRVGWHISECNFEGWVPVQYADIDWKFNQQFYGWGFSQFQAWARSTFVVPHSPRHRHHHAHHPQQPQGNQEDLDQSQENDQEDQGHGHDSSLCSVTIQCTNVGDFYVDNERLSGDWYGYGLTRHTLRLKPGSKHTLSVRVAHEVRIFGGVILPPPSKFRCVLKAFFDKPDDHPLGQQDQDQDQDRPKAAKPINVQVVKEGFGGIVLMDAVDDRLAGEFVGVALRNIGEESVYVRSVRVVQGSDRFSAEILLPAAETDASLGTGGKEMGVHLYPSIHRPIAIRLWQLPSTPPPPPPPPPPPSPPTTGSNKASPDWVHVEKADATEELETSYQLTFEFEIVSELVGSHGAGSSSSSSSPSSSPTRVTKKLETDPLVIMHKTWGEPYMYTFRDPDGTVQYAFAIPPANPESLKAQSAPVLVATHGAGGEVVKAKFWQLEFKRRERTWIVLPTGRSPWGYDWHGISTMNVLNSIQSLADDLPGVPDSLKSLPGIRPDPDRLFISGHSNGGQGAWYLVTHFPDKAIAAAPAAGYANIKQYVSYANWVGNSYSDALLRGILESSIIEFDNNLHMSNVVGIPVMARTGGIDDNVPPINSRMMVRLGQEYSGNMSSITLSEVSGANHWFVGILSDATVQKFMSRHLKDSIAPYHSPEDGLNQGCGIVTPELEDSDDTRVEHPPFPSFFEVTVVNPAGMESKGGIFIEQLAVPFRKGSVKVEIVVNKDRKGTPSTTWILKTTNVRRFSFPDSPSLQLRRGEISNLVIDGVVFRMDGFRLAGTSNHFSEGTFVRDHLLKMSRKWLFSESQEWKRKERHRDTYGPAIQILEKKTLIILGTRFSSRMPTEPDYDQDDDNDTLYDPSKLSKTMGGHQHRPHLDLRKTAERVAKLVAHDIYMYGRGDVDILTDKEYLSLAESLDSRLDSDFSERTNLVLIGDEDQNTVTKLVLGRVDQEVSLDSTTGLAFVRPFSNVALEAEYTQPGTGLLMIRPWGPRNLAMVIAGLDAQGLETAARLFPKRTGLLVPDWIITGPEMPWKGTGGVLAAGYWGNRWEYQPHMSA